MTDMERTDSREGPEALEILALILETFIEVASPASILDHLSVSGMLRTFSESFSEVETHLLASWMTKMMTSSWGALVEAEAKLRREAQRSRAPQRQQLAETLLITSALEASVGLVAWAASAASMITMTSSQEAWEEAFQAEAPQLRHLQSSRTEKR